MLTVESFQDDFFEDQSKTSEEFLHQKSFFGKINLEELTTQFHLASRSIFTSIQRTY